MSIALQKSNKSLSKKHALRASELFQQAYAHHQAGHLQQAEKLYLSLIKKYPNHVDTMYLLGVIAGQVGQHKIAMERFQLTLAIKPDFAEAHNNLGFALQQLGQEEQAIQHYKQAISIKPDYVDAYSNLGNTLNKSGHQEDALEFYKKILTIKPDYADAHYNMGIILQELGQHEDAKNHYLKALAIKPDIAEAHYNLTLIEPDQNQIHTIEKCLTNLNTLDENTIHFHHALANIYNKTREYSKAFEHVCLGNAIKRKTISYDSKQHSVFVDRIIESYSQDYFDNKTIKGSESELPVFILGMPRSGTTLVEQIISSHPQVYGAGELDYLVCIEKEIVKQYGALKKYPECISRCNDSDILKYSGNYLKKLEKLSLKTKRVTDKAPSNFLRIGLIKILFPNARIIHCKRNALDICTSIFLTYFTDGNEYSFDLTEIGQYYLDYERIMKHWHQVFPDQILDVQYEELINDQENISRQLIEYMGLEWDKTCLDFYNNKRAVKTASNSQVRQPIYNKSIERWKRYEEHLQPLIDVLQK